MGLIVCLLLVAGLVCVLNQQESTDEGIEMHTEPIKQDDSFLDQNDDPFITPGTVEWDIATDDHLVS